MLTHLMLASGNVRKRDEIERRLTGVVRSVTLLPSDAPDVVEDGDTFYANALKKANAAYDRYGIPSLADDSGLEAHALGNAPGVFSARYAGENASDAERIEKLLRELHGKKGSDRSANFRAVLVLMLTSSFHCVFEGVVYGAITDAPRGANGFGYDPVFVPNGDARTFAEMSSEEKLRVSHRGVALDQLRAWAMHMRETG